MRIEQGKIYVGTEPETKNSARGPFVTFRASFPNPKDAPQGTERVWYGVSAFDELAMQGLRDVHKGDEISFSGGFQTSNWTSRDGEKQVTPQLYLNAVLGVKAGTPYGGNQQPAAAHAAPAPSAMRAVADRHKLGSTPIPDAELSALDDGGEPLPF